MKRLLFTATTIFCGAVVFYVGVICYAIYQRLSWRKAPIDWSEFNPVTLIKGCFSEKDQGITGLVHKAFPFVILIGLVNMVLSVLFSSTTIGAFYEKSEYEVDYEAILYIDDKAVFCIADVQKWTDDREAFYRIKRVYLPYGGSEYVDAEYDVSDGKASLSLGDFGWDCDISLKAPATQSSYDLLDATVVSNYGEFCGSRESNIYHYPNCWNVKNIKTSNFIYFETDKEAEILGYEMCDVCRDLGAQEDDAPLSFSEWTTAPYSMLRWQHLYDAGYISLTYKEWQQFTGGMHDGVASEFLREKAREQREKTDREYGPTAYGSTCWDLWYKLTDTGHTTAAFDDFAEAYKLSTDK